jgi:AcrR family transcriptional regulator
MSDDAAGLGEITDKRLLRGARTRQLVLRRAVDVASLEGLGGVSFGRLAEDAGLSKAGVQTLFRSKEALQLATADYAQELFAAAVLEPAAAAPRGVARLRALVDRWIRYAREPLFAGGCFWAANLPEYDSRPGPVHDVLFAHHRQWLRLLAAELRHAAAGGEIAPVNADVAAFQIDAVLCAANTALRVGDRTVVRKVRLAVAGFLTPPG